MKYLVTSLLLVLFLICSGLPNALGDNVKPIIFMVERVGAKKIYEVNGKKIKLPDALDVLNDLMKIRGSRYPVVILFAVDIPLTEAGELEGIVQKVGFEQVKFYCFDAEKTSMSEVIVSKKSIPFYNGK